jgi:FkbM family methyltransferase
VSCRAEWETFADIFVNRAYDVPIQAALERANGSRPFNVLDLGANVGYFALRVVDVAARCGLEVPIALTLVEASARLCVELQERVVAQLPGRFSASVVHGLVGERVGSSQFHESAFHIGNSLRADPYARVSSVPYVDLDGVTASMHSVDLLKCDIEGAEQTFLQRYPALLDKVQVGVMEVHHPPVDPAICYELLKQRGFRVQITRSTEWFDEAWFDRPTAQ